MSAPGFWFRIRSTLDHPSRRVVDHPADRPVPPDPGWPAPTDLDDLRILLGRLGRLACAIAGLTAAEPAVYLWKRYGIWRHEDVDDRLPERALAGLGLLVRGDGRMARIGPLVDELHRASRAMPDARAHAITSGGMSWRLPMQQHVLTCLINAFGVLGDEPRDATMWAVLESARAAAPLGWTDDRYLARWWAHTRRRLAFARLRRADLVLADDTVRPAAD